jgi:Skp family chaperone for outer membrane proteins
MIKRAVLVVIGLGLTTLVLFGRDAASYVSTSYHRVTGAVHDSVPVEFQIDRAKQMVRDLDPEIRRSMHVIAKEEVALEQLNQQIDASQGKADKDKKDILHLQADLGKNKGVYQYASHTYTSDEVKQDLARRFSRFKVADDTLASMKQMRDARQKNLDAAQQKLAAMVNARRKLEVDVQNLEAKKKLVEVAQASSEYIFDDSQLARAKELITDIRTRLDVAAKLANADVDVPVEIPLDDATPADITDQVTEYFKLSANGDVAKDDASSEVDAVTAAFTHE